MMFNTNDSTKKLAIIVITIIIAINLIVICHSFPSKNDRNKKVTSNFFESTFFKSSSPSRTTTTKPFSSKSTNTEPFSKSTNTKPFSKTTNTKPFSKSTNTKPFSSFSSAPSDGLAIEDVPMENSQLLFGDVYLPKSFKMNSNLRNAMSFDDWLWPKGIIPVVIDKKLDRHRKLIIDSFNHYHQKTCLRFKERTNERDYVKFIYDEGCYSSIGRIGGCQTISLGDGCFCRGTIVHEIMHSLGFWHEQNRSDRDDYITVMYENIRSDARDQFAKLTSKQNRILTEYDYSSIMHYPGNAFSKSPELPSMIPKKPGVILKHACVSNSLSDLDLEKIRKLYKCAK